jgi:hypothetical protein
MPRALPRAHDGVERCFARALPDLRESRSETHRAGARTHCLFVDLARLPSARAPLRTVPAQIFLDSAEALLRGHSRTFVRGLKTEFPQAASILANKAKCAAGL